MRDFFRPSEAPSWLVAVLKSVREALGDIWPRPLRFKDYSTASLPSASDFKQGVVYDSDERRLAYSDGSAWSYLLSGTSPDGYESHLIVVGDETTAITTGNAKVTVWWPYRFRLAHPSGAIGVRAMLTTASSSGAVTLDIDQDGTSIFSTTPTIDANENTSVTAATPAVISNAIIEDNAKLTFDIVGAGTGAAGLKFWLVGFRDEEDGILLEGDMNTTGTDLEMLDGDMTDGDDILLQEAA